LFIVKKLGKLCGGERACSMLANVVMIYEEKREND
jgi:hypothetical protein